MNHHRLLLFWTFACRLAVCQWIYRREARNERSSGWLNNNDPFQWVKPSNNSVPEDLITMAASYTLPVYSSSTFDTNGNIMSSYNAPLKKYAPPKAYTPPKQEPVTRSSKIPPTTTTSSPLIPLSSFPLPLTPTLRPISFSPRISSTSPPPVTSRRPVFTTSRPVFTSSRPSEQYPTYASIPSNLSFGCRGREPGYYADPQADCQVWHWCTPNGQIYSFLCPNQTLFNQAVRVCDWWYNVDCSQATSQYSVNRDLYV